MKDDPLGVEHRPKPSANGNKPDESFIIDILHHQTDLIHVGCNHDLKVAAPPDGNEVAHTVFGYFIYMTFQFSADNITN